MCTVILKTPHGFFLLLFFRCPLTLNIKNYLKLSFYMQPLSDITTECYIVAYSLISPNVKIKVLQPSVKSWGKGALVETVPCGS